MKPGRRRSAVAFASVVVLAALTVSLSAQAGNGVTGKRDEFGVVPEEPHDKDLMIPDPVLDRTWAGPKPGEGHRSVEKEPEEDDESVPEPEQDDEAARPSKDEGDSRAGQRRGAEPRGAEPKDPYEVRSAQRPPAAMIGPDGHRDPGGPAPEIDPSLPDVLGKDAPDLSDLERDEARPSTYDRGGGTSHDAGDAGDAGDSGGAGE